MAVEKLLLADHPPWRRVLIGVACVAMALLARAAFAPWIGASIPFVTLFPGILAAGLLAGWTGGLTAILCSVAYSTWMIATRGPGYPLESGAAIAGTVLFVLGSLFTVWAAHLVRVNMARAWESGARLTAALSASRVGTWRWEIDADRTYWDAQLAELYGVEPQLAPHTTADFLALVHPDDRDALASELSSALARQDVTEQEFRILRPDGSIAWIYDRARIERNAAGRPTMMIGASLDISARKRAEQENAHLAAIVLGSRDAIVSFNPDGRIMSWNAGAQAMFGIPAEKAVGVDAKEMCMLPIGLGAAAAEALAGRSAAFEGPALGASGAPIQTNVVATPITGAHGRVIGASCIIRDDTDRHAAMETQTLLVRELHHRVRNTLGAVQALITSTARTAASAEELRDSLSRRVRSLARTHELVTRADAQQASVRELLGAELEAFADPASRVSLIGADVELRDSETFNFAMAVHELATNAAKYGALSVPEGRVEVEWRLEADDKTLVLHWRETGGPAPLEHRKTGFGMSLLKRLFPGPDDIRFDFAPQGFSCELRMRLYSRQKTAD